MSKAAQEGTEVLEFDLGDERYCIDIDYVAEIVDRGELTTVPNTEPQVEGVMDLRGRTTTIVDPKVPLDIDEETAGRRIIIFDHDVTGESGATGWIVDEVNRVIRIPEEDVDPSPTAETEAVEAVVKQDDAFIVWIDPTTTVQ